jgi:hypothetical protein
MVCLSRICLGNVEELAEQFHEEIDTNFREVIMDFYFVWAQHA